ncbi:hypothetical protein CEXT_28601 [Caerostris extrusa]|uniref:Uncharacterized protein n=1 Tax=Caerostris extrusa TaxID=172846 RepID=A0AAV4TZI3_CAEEX|nr:hypothetical protein CEXT_28601 [Caerostris extrusa]
MPQGKRCTDDTHLPLPKRHSASELSLEDHPAVLITKTNSKEALLRNITFLTSLSHFSFCFLLECTPVPKSREEKGPGASVLALLHSE